MFEKVNPLHPDKVADRIAGAIVDMAYAHQTNPKISVEVLVGHFRCGDNGIFKVLYCPRGNDYICLMIKNQVGEWELCL